MSTIKVASIQDLSGNPYKGMEVRGSDLASGQTSVILNNINNGAFFQDYSTSSVRMLTANNANTPTDGSSPCVAIFR